jgi:hypothetical protein
MKYLISEELREKVIGEIANVVGELLRAKTTEGIEALEEQLDKRDRRIEELVEKLAKMED